MERIDDSREDKWALAEGKYYIRDYEHRSMNDGDFIRFLLSLEWSFDNFSSFFCSLFLLLLFLSISSVSTTTRQLKIFFAQRDWIIFERQFSRISFRTWSIGCAYNLEWEWLSVFLWCIFFYAFPVHNWWDIRVPRRLITVELGFAIELHAAYRYTFEEKRHRVLVNVVVTSRRSIARKKKKIACLPFFFLFSALMFVLPHSISNNEFLSSRCTKVKLFLVFFFSNATKFLVRLFSI